MKLIAHRFAPMPEQGPRPTDRMQEAQLDAERVRQQEADDLAWLMSDKRGRRFMYRLLGDCRLYETSFEAENTHLTAWREGVRNIGLLLVAQLSRDCPDRMSEMFKEVTSNVRLSSK